MINTYQKPQIYKEPTTPGIPMVPIQDGIDCRLPGSTRTSPRKQIIIQNFPLFIRPPNFRDPNKDSCPVPKNEAKSSGAANSQGGDVGCSDDVNFIYMSPDQPDQGQAWTNPPINAGSVFANQPTDTKDTQLSLLKDTGDQKIPAGPPGQLDTFSLEQPANLGNNSPELQRTTFEIPPSPNVDAPDISPFQEANTGYTSTIPQSNSIDTSLVLPTTSEYTAALDSHTNSEFPGILQESSGASLSSNFEDMQPAEYSPAVEYGIGERASYP